MRKFLTVFLAIMAIVSLSMASILTTSAEENELEIHDELLDSKNPPSGVEYVNFGYDQDYSLPAYFGEGGDLHAFKLNGTNVAYAEYTVSNVNSIEALSYIHKDWGTVSYIKTNSSEWTQNQYVAWGLPAGDDYIPRYISKSTGLMYVQVNGNWWAYTDTATIAGGDYSYFNTETTNYPSPTEDELIPYGVGFAYTIDGETWQWAERELDVTSLKTNGTQNREVWKAKNLPPMIKKVRVYLVDRAVYVKSDQTTGQVVQADPTNSIGWYLAIADVKIGYYKDVENNNAPVANDISIECLQGRAVEFEINVTDVDGDAVNVLFDKTNLKGDILKVSGNRYKYVAPKDEFGEYSCTYKGYDSYAYSNEATISVKVIEHDGRYVESDLKMEYPETDVITLNEIFADGMILQQKQKDNIWGLTIPGSEVSYALKDKTGATKDSGTVIANQEGYFKFVLNEQDASFDKWTLTVSDQTGEKTISNILFGEVWMASGQSNMELQAQYCIDTAELLKNANNEYIRFFLEPTTPYGSVAANYSYTPVYHSNGVWGFGNNYDDAKVVSAVAYAYALEMFEALNVPVAIINTAIGASSVEAWVSRKSIEDNEAFLSEMKARGLFVDSVYWNTKNEWNFNQMTALFNSKVAPIAGYGMKGVIWYQGSNDLGDYTAAVNYKNKLKTLIEDWAYWWGVEHLPLCVVELTTVEYNYLSESLAFFREQQRQLWLENEEWMTFTTAYDIRPEYKGTNFPYISPCHPLYKEEIGRRLARTSLCSIYKLAEFADCLPPVVTDMKIENGKIILTYDNVGSGLKVKDGENHLKGFALCGENRIFVPANAVIISKNQVEVSSPYVDSPVAVTYAFAGLNMKSNLYNSNGFPATLYRSDLVASQYYHPKDWMDADSLTEWMCYGFNDNNSEYEKVWVSNPISSGKTTTISLNTEDLVYGAASIVLSYGANGGAAGAVNRTQRDQFDFNAIFGHMDNYGIISLWLKNPDNRDKEFSVVIKTKDGKVYTLCQDGKNTATVIIPANSEWTEYVFSLTSMIEYGRSTVVVDETAVAGLSAMEFVVNDNKEGSMLIDKLQLFLAIERNEYTVTFETGIKQTIPEQIVVEGEVATQPEIQERIGYNFIGWFVNDVEYDFTTPVTQDITITAKWELKKINYTVKFVTGTSDVIADQTVEEGLKATMPTTSLTREGYTFEGWYLNGVEYNFNTAVNSDITLVAQWKEVPQSTQKKGCKMTLDGSLFAFALVFAIGVIKEKKSK